MELTDDDLFQVLANIHIETLCEMTEISPQFKRVIQKMLFDHVYKSGDKKEILLLPSKVMILEEARKELQNPYIKRDFVEEIIHYFDEELNDDDLFEIFEKIKPKDLIQLITSSVQFHRVIKQIFTPLDILSAE